MKKDRPSMSYETLDSALSDLFDQYGVRTVAKRVCGLITEELLEHYPDLARLWSKIGKALVAVLREPETEVTRRCKHLWFTR